MNDLTFIETQFPVAKLSAEAYKERKAGASQTLTSLGKWWGRKPLVLVRAALLGLLLPASDDPKADLQVFLSLMTMDDEGLWRRKNRPIPQAVLLEQLAKLPPSTRRRFAEPDPATGEWTLRRLSANEREELQRLVFNALPYSEKLTYCLRPEQVEGPSPQAWERINAHLGTQAASLPELVEELGRRRFGGRPRVGDAFCGGGSVPFEAARLGCDVYASDLNPVAALLTWAALNILGGGEEVAEEVRRAQQVVFQAVDEQICEWGIEHNELGWRADVYLYCSEARCPECGWRVPLAPSWVISEKYGVIAEWLPDEQRKAFDVQIREGVGKAELARAEQRGTVRNSRLYCPHCGMDTPMEVVRRNLRLWENHDLTPRPDDVFQERLYCIRWVETYTDERGEQRTRRHYRAPTAADLRREEKVLDLLRERFAEWQEKGYLPARRIEPGDETSRLQRERGWTHWHHLFHPRQLLVLGLTLARLSKHEHENLGGILLRIGAFADSNSKLCRWNPDASKGPGGTEQTFYNQALNTILNYGIRTADYSWKSFFHNYSPSFQLNKIRKIVLPIDARNISHSSSIWITDPPYADAVNYHELSEFFLAWYEKHLPRLFPGWYADSRRALAIRGGDPLEFRKSMVAAYQNLTDHMPENGLHIVMFTHQNAAVWADLTLILWAAGLRVTAAWTIATETDIALKQGNYVQGTVLLVCRKRGAAEPAFVDELLPRIEREVKTQLQAMLALDDPSEPNFSDADYQLAAYAAALRVLTAQPIEDIEIEREITAVRRPGEEGRLERLIREAVRVACDYLIPQGIESHIWRGLTPAERFYLKGLEVESHGEYRVGVYQELARGFGVSDYADLLASTRANQTRLKTPRQFGRRQVIAGGFGSSLLRQVLFALWAAEEQQEPRRGLDYLKTELPDYWEAREKMIAILEYLSRLRRVSGMEHWQQPSEQAEMIAVLMRHDSL